MAKYEGEFEAAGPASLDAGELIAALGRTAPPGTGNRSQAVADCLSGQDGWHDAAARLGGAFAKLGGATGLTGGKE